MRVNKMSFLTSVGYPIRYRKTLHLVSNSTATIRINVYKTIRMYNDADFIVVEIRCNHVLRQAMEGLFEDEGCTITYTNNAQEDETNEETNNEIIKRQV